MFVDINIILLGAAGVGKTSIYIRYFDHSWNRQIHKSTIGQDVRQKKFPYGGTDYTIAVWDTAGSERYNSITPTLFRRADYAILCFDPSLTDSWTKALFWFEELQKVNNSSKVLICATKKDLIDNKELNYNVDHEEIRQFALKTNAVYIHVSSKTGENVDTIFKTIVEKCLEDDNFRRRHNERVRENEEQNCDEIKRNAVIREHNGCC